MAAGTNVVVVLSDGRELRGVVIEQVGGMVNVHLENDAAGWYARFRVFEV